MLQTNLKYHLYEVQTEIVERLALEDGAGVFRLLREHKVCSDEAGVGGGGGGFS